MFITKYSILFDTEVNGIVSLISLSDLLLLECRNASYFCVLILYPATLLNSSMSSSILLLVSLGFSICSIMSSANCDSFTSSFPFGSLLYLFLLCDKIALARTSKTMLKRSGESGHPCLVPHLRENAFSYSPLSMMLAMGLLFMAFIILRYVPSVPTFWRIFIINYVEF